MDFISNIRPSYLKKSARPKVPRIPKEKPIMIALRPPAYTFSSPVIRRSGGRHRGEPRRSQSSQIWRKMNSPESAERDLDSESDPFDASDHHDIPLEVKFSNFTTRRVLNEPRVQLSRSYADLKPVEQPPISRRVGFGPFLERYTFYKERDMIEGTGIWPEEEG